ncbi:hypothetical protein LY474_16880 [Myxococcus stipitatus]|uniref:hypothetical protein n=1 Tax=Myxococcus stipitatus TaxID=83455 RepID=UPI001F23054A|nr:hypothetical protein [Myxococcus stipitatus]MCE9669487.1 hypothetical protein [Myxococcus stipitatus]
MGSRSVLAAVVTASLVTARTAGADESLEPNFSQAARVATVVSKPNARVAFPSGALTGTLDVSQGRFTGVLTVGGSVRTTFNLAGFPPVTATVTLVLVGGVSGEVDASMRASLVQRTNIRLSDVWIGFIPVSVGSQCLTSRPVDVEVSGTLALDGPSTLTGSYFLPDFANCGFATATLNLLVPGPDNAVTVTLNPSGSFEE